VSGADKEVKISVVVVPADAAKARTEIGLITAEVKKLIDLTRTAGTGLGGLFGARVSNTAGSPGTSAGTQLTHTAAGQSGGVVGILTGGVRADSNVIRGVAESTKSSIKTMKDGLKDLADAGERESARLQRSFGKLAPLYAAAGAQVASQRLSGLQAAGAAQVAAMRGTGAGPGGVPPTPPGGMPPWLKSMIGGATGATTAWAAERMLVGGYARNYVSDLNYQIQSPTFISQGQASAGDIFGGAAVAIRHGDIGRAWAMSRISDKNNKEASAQAYQKIISADYKKALADKRRIDAPLTLGENITANAAGGGTGIPGAWNYVANQVGIGATFMARHPWEAAKQLAGIGLGVNIPVNPADRVTGSQAMARQTLEAAQVTAQAEAAAAAQQRYMREHVQFTTDVNEFYGSALGDTGLARAARISGSFYKTKDGRFGDSVQDYMARATEMGISGGERAGMAHRLAQAAGQGFFGHGDVLQGPEAGGLGIAAGLYGVGGQFGGGGWGGASAFMRNFQHQIGRGGLDIGAANSVGSAIMAAMQGGNFGGGNGMAFSSAMLQMASNGSTGGDMLGARQATAGMGAFGNILAGGSSPLDKALNWSAAIRTGGNIPWSARAKLASMDPATLIELMRGGDKNISPVLKNLGITAANTMEYMKLRGPSLFAGVLDDDRFMTAGMRSTFHQFQASGGNTHFMRGMKGKQRQQAESALAAVAMARNGSLTLDQATGEVRAMEAAWGDLDPLSGRGAGDSVSRKSPRAQALRMQARFDREKGARLSKGESEQGAVSGALKAMHLTAEAAEAAGIDTAAQLNSGGGINGTINQLDAILRKFVSQLHGEVGGGGAGPPGG
jgi:hypothetical protein